MVNTQQSKGGATRNQLQTNRYQLLDAPMEPNSGGSGDESLYGLAPDNLKYGRQSITLSACDQTFPNPCVFTCNRVFTILRFIFAGIVFGLSVYNMTSEEMLMTSLDDIVSNWSETPFTQIAVVPYIKDTNSTTIVCPEGYTPYGYLGQQRYLVGAASEEYIYDSEQYAWKKNAFCVLRPEAMTSATKRVRVASVDEACPVDMLQCGTDCYDKSIINCPISSISINPLATSHAPDNAHFDYNGVSYEFSTIRQGDSTEPEARAPLLDLTVGIQKKPVTMCIGMLPGSHYVRHHCSSKLVDRRYLSIDSYSKETTSRFFSAKSDENEDDDDDNDDDDPDGFHYETIYFEENFSPEPVLDVAKGSTKDVALFIRQEIPWKYVPQTNAFFFSDSDDTMTPLTPGSTILGASNGECNASIEEITPKLRDLNKLMNHTNKYLFTVAFFYILFSFSWLFLSAGQETDENSVEWGCTLMGYRWGMGIFFFFIFDLISLYIIWNFASPSSEWIGAIRTARHCVDSNSKHFLTLYNSFVDRAILAWIILGGYCLVAIVCNVVTIRLLRFFACCLFEPEQHEPIYLYPRYGTPEYFDRYSRVVKP